MPNDDVIFNQNIYGSNFLRLLNDGPLGLRSPVEDLMAVESSDIQNISMIPFPKALISKATSPQDPTELTKL